MSLLNECKMIIFVSLYSFAVLILIGVHVDKSVALEVEIPDIDSVDFGTPADSTDIDNFYMPLIPGTTFYYEAETEDGLEETITEVTSDTKIILGINTIVVHDMAFLEGAMAPFYLFGFSIINHKLNQICKRGALEF